MTIAVCSNAMTDSPSSCYLSLISPQTSPPVRPLSSLGTSLVNVLLSGCLVLGDEVLNAVLGEPAGESGQFVAEAVDGLLVHVGLGDEFREGDYSCVRW
jgi:hypothetical protein